MASTVIPTLRYNDPKRAIEFLCVAFGFERHQVHEDGKGAVMHAELRHGTGLVMIGPNVESKFGKYIRLPKEFGGFETQVTFIVVENPEAHFKKAKENGAEILMPLTKKDYGASDYACRDPEGHIWSFGDYNPWAKK
ncbi:MAG: VOC family protein [Deltaproteobacteria bacterium]|jgi:uncharacterized glyoxalase superfamily protein PhnB|nr:VOC family protein [Deltaproteobacteria bacterium]